MYDCSCTRGITLFKFIKKFISYKHPEVIHVDDEEEITDEIERSLWEIKQTYDSETTSVPSEEDLRRKLIAFFECNAPGKLISVDILLAKFAGRGDVLIKSLETKYGVSFFSLAKAQQSMLPVRDQLIALFSKYNPTRVDTVDILFYFIPNEMRPWIKFPSRCNITMPNYITIFY